MKKFLSLLLAMLIALTCAIGLVACSPDAPGGQTPGGQTPGGNTGGGLPGGLPGGGGSSAGKTIIEWANCGGGIGRQWIDAAAAEYEQLNANRSFEDGKMGIDIQVEAIKSTGSLVNATEGRDLITLEFTHINDHASKDLLLDLTPLYNNEDLDGDGVGDFGRYDTDGVTIAERILPEARAFASMPYANGNGGYDFKYYALPHYEYLSGLTYNRELFDANGWYFTEAQDGSDGGFEFETKFGNVWLIGDIDGEIDDEATISTGPDFDFDVPEVGAPDYAEKKARRAEDDGLPRSLQELAALCYIIRNYYEMEPIQYPGMYPDYDNILPCGLYASLAGYEGLQATSTFKGTIEVIKGDPQQVNGKTASPALRWKNTELFTGTSQPSGSKAYTAYGCETEWVTLDPDGSITGTADATKGWYTQEQAAKYYAAAFMQIAEKENFFSVYSSQPTVSHTDSELLFLTGDIGNRKRIAMLMESTYWWNEAGNAGVWNDYRDLSGNKDCFDKDVRFMPLPSVLTNADYATSQRKDWSNTMVDTGYCSVFALKQAGNDPQHKLAIYDFLSFLYSKEQLELFTKRTGMYRPLKYDIEQEDLEDLSIFTQHYHTLRENGKIVRHSGDNPYFVQQGKGLGIQIWGDTWALGDTRSSLAIARNGQVKDFFEANRMAPGTWEAYLAKNNGQWIDFGLDEAP